MRKLPSGRYQARYRVDGLEYTEPVTFRTRREADAWLASVRADLERGMWVDPDAGRTTLAEYTQEWLDTRQLRPRTRELYESELRLHILPALGDVELGRLSPAWVRAWHADLLASERPGETTVAKCYRLLRAVLATAVEVGVLVRNPCAIKGAGVERHAERPVATVEQVYALADAAKPRCRGMVLLATFTGLRLGEPGALRRRHLDLLHGAVTVVEQLQEPADGSLVFGPPKSDAGRRTVAVPEAIVPDLQAHLGRWAAPGPDGLLSCGNERPPLRRATFYAAWHRAVRAVGVPDLHFHDYADLRVIPTSTRRPLRCAVIAACRSA